MSTYTAILVLPEFFFFNHYNNDNATQLGGLLIYLLNKCILTSYYVPEILIGVSRRPEKHKGKIGIRIK